MHLDGGGYRSGWHTAVIARIAQCGPCQEQSAGRASLRLLRLQTDATADRIKVYDR